MYDEYFTDREQAIERQSRIASEAFYADQSIRCAVHQVFLSLPVHSRSIDELERHMHRLVYRALRDFKADLLTAVRLGGEESPPSVLSSGD